MQLKSIAEEAADCRAAWAAAPDAKVAHCCHHKIHIEPLTEPAENRIAYILSEKRNREQALRLRLFRPWPAGLPKAVQKAYADLQKANADLQKADADVQTSPAFKKQHAKLFPDCTWNGKSIFKE